MSDKVTEQRVPRNWTNIPSCPLCKSKDRLRFNGKCQELLTKYRAAHEWHWSYWKASLQPAALPSEPAAAPGWLKPVLQTAVTDRETWPAWQKGAEEPAAKVAEISSMKEEQRCAKCGKPRNHQYHSGPLTHPSQAHPFSSSEPEPKPEPCKCEDWEPCGCGNQPPAHCMYCCHDLSAEQLAAFDFETWEHIPPRPKHLPSQISCGACGVKIDNPTKADMDFHFNPEHLKAYPKPEVGPLCGKCGQPGHWGECAVAGVPGWKTCSQHGYAIPCPVCNPPTEPKPEPPNEELLEKEWIAQGAHQSFKTWLIYEVAKLRATNPVEEPSVPGQPFMSAHEFWVEWDWPATMTLDEVERFAEAYKNAALEHERRK